MIEQFLALDFRVIAIMSGFFGAIANIFARVLLKDIDSTKVSGLSFLIMGSVLLVFSPSFYFFTPTWAAIFLLYLISIVDAVGNYFYFKVFEKSEASIATSLLSISPFFAFIGSFLILGTNIPIMRLVLAFGIMITIALTTADIKDFKRFSKQTLIPAVLAAACFGLSSIPSKILLTELGVINAPTLYMFRATIIGMISLIIAKPNLRELKSRHYRLIVVRGLIVIATWVLMYYALTKGDSGVTSTLANITPVFTLLLGGIFLKEQITKKKVTGILIVISLSLFMLYS